MRCPWSFTPCIKAYGYLLWLLSDCSFDFYWSGWQRNAGACKQTLECILCESSLQQTVNHGWNKPFRNGNLISHHSRGQQIRKNGFHPNWCSLCFVWSCTMHGSVQQQLHVAIMCLRFVYIILRLSMFPFLIPGLLTLFPVLVNLPAFVFVCYLPLYRDTKLHNLTIFNGTRFIYGFWHQI